MARLLSYGRISPTGLLAWSPARQQRTTWSDLQAGPATDNGLPALRARWFFDAPYTKFGRMDVLCKVASAAAQLALRDAELDHDEVAQVGGTMLGCLEVDAKFEATRAAGAPSPALFVYTLPSMFQGEIAIQHRLRGRCALLSAGRLSALTALATGVRWVDRGRAKQVLVVAAEAAGDAAAALGYARHTNAAAWLLGREGGLLGLTGAAFVPGGETLTPGELLHGCTLVDTLEARLLAGTHSRVGAEADGFGASFDVTA